VVDGDGNGRDEVILSSGFTANGERETSASIVRIGPEGLVTLRRASDLPEARFDDKGDGGGERILTHVILHARRYEDGGVEYGAE
jgi:hypothetical protein